MQVTRALLFWIWLPFVKLEPIVGGSLVKDLGFEKYSYTVSLQEVKQLLNTTKQFVHFCGGSLIHSKWILTAAHCVYKKTPESFVVAIGANYLSSNNIVHYKVRRSEINHFCPYTLKNDIALVELYHSVIINNNIKIGNLPSLGIKASRKRPCKIFGYGAITYAGQSQNYLHQGKINVIHNKKCVEILGRIMGPKRGDNTVCAVGDKQDSCQGDSGGPMICSVRGQEYIFGIVSHGSTCSDKGAPSIYTITTPYVNWITSIINKQ